MMANIEVTDTGLISLRRILTAYIHQSVEDVDTAQQLRDRVFDVMNSTPVGNDPMDDQTHMFYTETDEETRVLRDALQLASERGPKPRLAQQLRDELT